MATPYEWRIDAIEQKAQRACVDGLRSALDSALTRIEQLERIVEELSSANQRDTDNALRRV